MSKSLVMAKHVGIKSQSNYYYANPPTAETHRVFLLSLLTTLQLVSTPRHPFTPGMHHQRRLHHHEQGLCAESALCAVPSPRAPQARSRPGWIGSRRLRIRWTKSSDSPGQLSESRLDEKGFPDSIPFGPGKPWFVWAPFLSSHHFK